MKKLLLLFLLVAGGVSTASAATIYYKKTGSEDVPKVHVWGDGVVGTTWGTFADMTETNLYGITVYKYEVSFTGDEVPYNFLFAYSADWKSGDVTGQSGDVCYKWNRTTNAAPTSYNYSVSKVEVKGDLNSWGDGQTMTLSDGVYSATVDLSSSISNQDIKFLVTNGAGDTGWLGWSTNTLTKTDTGSLLSQGSDDNFTVANGNKTYKTYNVSLTLSTPTTWALTFAGNETRGSKTYSLTVTNDAGWSNVKVYTFGPDLNQSGTWSTTDDMTNTSGSTWTYSKTFYEPYPEKVLFKDVNGDASNKTADLKLINGHTYTNQAVEKLYVIGNIPELGNWAESTSAAMTFVENGDQDYHTFTVENVDLSSNVEFKIMRKSYDEAVSKTAGLWPANNRTVSVSEVGKYNVEIRFLSYWNNWSDDGIASGTATLVSVPAVVSDAGYATFVSTHDLDYTGTDIKAYTAKVNTGNGNVVLSQIDKVPANTPVILHKAGGATEDIPAATTTDTPEASDLVAGTGSGVASTADSYCNYILNVGSSGIGFYWANGQTVATNRAYLHTTYNVHTPGARLSIVFADETTGIKSIDNGQLMMDNYYDLQGRRVAQPTKGLYIVNGKKIIK